MDLFATHKTWNFMVNATSEQCFQAFFQALKQPGFKILGSKWQLERGQSAPPSGGPNWPAMIASYQGRGGVVGVTSQFAVGRIREISQDEEQKAIGSQITFAINPQSVENKTECSLWLSKFVSRFGFTFEGRHFLSALHDVEKHLRMLDPSLTVSKS